MKVSLRQYLQLLLKYFKPHRLKVLSVGVLLLGGISLQVINPQFIRYFIDEVTSQAEFSDILMVALLFIALSFIQQILRTTEVYVAEDLGWAATNKLREDVTHHVISLDTSFHKMHSVGDLIERIDGDISFLANFFSKFTLKIFGNVLFIIGVVVVLFITDWRIGTAFGFFTVFAIIVLTSLRGLSVEEWTIARKSSAKLYAFVEERLSGIEDIRSNGGVKDAVYRLCFHMSNLLKDFLKARLSGNLSFIIVSVLFVLGEAMALGMGMYFYFQGNISIGTVFILLFYMQILISPLNELTGELQDLQSATASISRIIELQKIKSIITDGKGILISEVEPPSIEYKEVMFGYSNNHPVLHNISFSIEAGEVVGIIGPTGSGKSSMVQLLLRLYDPQSGQVCINGNDIRDARLEQLRQYIGVVTQDVQTFRGTVRDNLTFYKEYDDKQLLDVFRELGLWELYQQLPEGLDTMVESNGGGLSAGEAQLLAFARIFLQNPKIIVLDEASSRLDPVTENLVQNATKKLLKDRTGIIISHKLETLKLTTKLLLIENGHVAEIGVRSEMEKDSESKYFQLLKINDDGVKT